MRSLIGQVRYLPLPSSPFFLRHILTINDRIGEPMGKAEFLRIIGSIRAKAFNQRIIRESFKDRGIYPVDGSKVLDKLSNGWDNIPDLVAPNLPTCGSYTPSPPPTALSSSSVDQSPPKSTEDLIKNQTKLSKHTDLLTPKLQRNLDRIFHHNRMAIEHLNLANGTISQIRATQQPIQRSKTKRQIKGLSHTGILTTRDANRAIANRKAKEETAEQKRFAKDYKKRFGHKPQLPDLEESEASIEAARASQANGEVYFFDSTPMR